MLVIAGWNQGSQEAMLRRLIATLGAADTVCLAGPQFGDDKAASFARADAFVLPSLSEGLPVAVLEAWSYGLPVLMTEACNLPEGFAAGAALRIGTDGPASAPACASCSRCPTRRDVTWARAAGRSCANGSLGRPSARRWPPCTDGSSAAARRRPASSPIEARHGPPDALGHHSDLERGGNLPLALASLRGLDAELFVVDSGSTDHTLAIARAAGCHVVEHPFENYAAAAQLGVRSPADHAPHGPCASTPMSG